MKDFKPVRSGTLTVRFVNGGEITESFTIDGPARDGIFLLDPVIQRPGDYRVELALASTQVASRHVLPAVQVFATEADVPFADDEETGGIAFLKEQQWQMPFEVVAARLDTVRRTVTAPGEIAPPDGALVTVSAPTDGIAAAAVNRDAPSVGHAVRRGDVLAVLSPAAQSGGFAELRARVERLEREVARAERLLAAGAIPGKRLDEARRDLEIARAEAAAMGHAGTTDDYQLRLTAPINGVIADRSFVPGGRVSVGDHLFTIVDPRTAWLRVQVDASVAADIAQDARASFTIDGSDEMRRTGPLLSIGAVLNPATRTVPVVFLLTAAASDFTFGLLAQAAVPIQDVFNGVVIPNRAIVDDNGTPVAYVQAGGETFERRILMIGATDGARSHIVSGIRTGEMVVVTGAYQIRLASLSGNEFAGAHAH
jgi:RND family efflux transporter MFP subunit